MSCPISSNDTVLCKVHYIKLMKKNKKRPATVECGLLPKHYAFAAVYALYQFLCMQIVLWGVVGLKIPIILKMCLTYHLKYILANVFEKQSTKCSKMFRIFKILYMLIVIVNTPKKLSPCARIFRLGRQKRQLQTASYCSTL